MTDLSSLKSGSRLYDKQRGRERLIHSVEPLGRVVKIWFKDAQTGMIEPTTFPVSEVERRFEVIGAGTSAFRADSELVRLLVESYRLSHAYLFNPAFATETSLIDALPHQLIAVYDHMLNQPRLRFLLADDAGAGKTIMAGLCIREMLLRRLINRVLIVPPAGLMGNWERELRNLFRLRFRILDSTDAQRDNPFVETHNDLAIVSVDTLWRDRMRGNLFDAPPYDLVIFDEAHKLSARRNPDGTVDKSNRYILAEAIAAQNRHLLLLTATPHMGKDDPYYFLWRLLEPELLAAQGAFERMNSTRKRAHLLRRMKEQMVRFDETPLYPPRKSHTIEYPLTAPERRLYDQVTQYCETHYDRAKRRNQSAAKLAMGILQRRLASSTWALLQSLERRSKKLTEDLRKWESGLLTEDELRRKQEALPSKDWREAKTADEEEAEGGQEESERLDEESSGATDARTIEELREEIGEVDRLVTLAREVFALKHESKFERLWQALQDYPDTKILIFTEHRDTANFLVDRLEGLGQTGRIARIDGTLDYKQRDIQAEYFRTTARYLVATDAAGEGINLQFCWLLVNYDIPWNPARIEQRMGRVHRYKQKHEVLLMNLVAEGTREGRVLKVLLEKLERIRKELGTDRVFDVIGQQFKGKSLSELIFEATVGGRADEVEQEIDQAVTQDKMRIQLAEQARKVEVSEVRSLLEALKQQRETAELRRMMPAYVRGFFKDAAPLVGVALEGDPTRVFRLLPNCPDAVCRALENYPEELRERLTFDRLLAMPEDALQPEAVYLHPGETVFDTVAALFQNQYNHAGDRGALYFDESATEPYLFFLVKVPILREPLPHSEEPPGILDETMIGVRRYSDGRCEKLPAHWLMTLIAAEQAEEAELPAALLESADDVSSIEAFMYETEGTPRLEQLRAEALDRLPERRRQVREAYGLREAELLNQRRILQEAVAKNIPAAKAKLGECERELDTLDARRAEAEAALISEVDRIGLGPVTIYIRALVLPIPPEQAQRRRDERIEQIAMQIAWNYEEERGASVEDVSDPQRKMGFDLRSTRPDGTVRYIEVKGRARIGEVELTPNEWAQANNHHDRYWLYVVFNCDTVPMLKCIADPAGRSIGQPKGGITIDAAEIIDFPGE